MFLSIENLGKVIRYHRKKAGLTQTVLAKFAGVGKTVIFDIEKGKSTVQLSTLFSICNVLNIKFNYKSPLMESFEKENL